MGAAAVIAGGTFAIEVPLLSVFLVPFIVPMLSVSVRRLHDTGKSGWRTHRPDSGRRAHPVPREHDDGQLSGRQPVRPLPQSR
jgi:hypothetical protein|nr:DUF805 domain-containing protein [Streptomyces mirabilis]